MLAALLPSLCPRCPRGYGGSTGSPSEAGIKEDALAAERWLRKRLTDDGQGQGPVVYFGESLGTSAAIYLATQIRPAGLVLQSGFSSCVDVAASIYGRILPVRLLMKVNGS